MAPISINGSGTVTGVSAGGLPDASIVTADIADANITAAKLSGAQTGTAPIYGCRAWVSFNGTGTIGTNMTIRASGNVSSVYKNATGDYTVNFTTAMPDANYAFAVSPAGTGSDGYGGGRAGQDPTSGSIRISVWAYPNLADSTYVTCSVFR